MGHKLTLPSNPLCQIVSKGDTSMLFLFRTCLVMWWLNSDRLPCIKTGRVRFSFRRTWQGLFYFETDSNYKRLEMGYVSIIYRGVSK